MNKFTFNYKTIFGGSRIGRRLMTYVLVFSTLLTLMISAVQLKFNYDKELDELERRFVQIEKSYLKSLETAVWRLDHEQLDTLLKGILTLRDIAHIEIAIDSSAITEKIGIMPESKISREYPLSFAQNQRITDLGRLRVTATFDGISKRLYADLGVILIGNTIAIFSIAIFIFFYVQESITKNLARISQYAKKINHTQIQAPLELPESVFRSNEEDELNEVVRSIDEMQQNLYAGYRALVSSEDRLKIFAEAASDWLWETNDALEYTYVSDRFFEITGFHKNQVIGQNQAKLYEGSEDSQEWMQHQTGLVEREPFRDVTLSLSTPAGELCWLRISGRPIFGDEDQFEGYRGTGTDITNEVRAREEAIETTLRFLDAIENVSDGIAFWDANDCFVLCNRIFRSQAGDAANYLVRGTPFEAYMRGLLATGAINKSQTEQEEWLKRRIKERKQQTEPVEVYRDGKWLLIRDGRASDGSTVSVSTNITEVKQREQQLQQVTNAVPILLAYVDQDLRFQMVNKEYELCFEILQHEVIGDTVGHTLAKETYDQLKPHIKTVLDGKFVRFQIKLSNSVTGAAPDHNHKHLDASFTPNFDRRGDVVGFFVAAIDVTELVLAEEIARQREQALSDQTHILRASIEAMAQGISIWDEDKNLIIWNQNFESFLRFPNDFLHRGLPINEAVDKAIALGGIGLESVNPTIDRTEPTAGNNWSETVNIKYNNGQMLVGQRYETATGGSIFMLTDITEQTRAQEQIQHTQRIEAMGKLTGGIAHDFNNLLAIIIGSLNLLEDRVAEPRSEKLVSSALRASRRGADLTQRLLAFGRRQALMTERTNANHLVESISELLVRTLGADVKVMPKLGTDLWTMDVDRGQLENALLNLAINARDAMPNGGKVTIETANILLGKDYAEKHQDVEPGAFVMISVTDNGTGMTAQVAERAIEPFFTTKQVGAGSGLGLSMIYGFANQSGGHMSIYSELGHGTVVRIYLPATEGEVDTIDASTEHIGYMSNGEHILVIEDDADVRLTTVHILNELGYLVTEAANEDEAMSAIESDASFDLVFSDVFLQGSVSGPAIVKKIQAGFPKMKILFTSGFTADQFDDSDFHGSNMEFIPKPFEIHALSIKLRELFDDNPATIG